MANIEDTAIFISLALIAIHAFALAGSQQLLGDDYSNLGFSFLPSGADSSDLNASDFEVFNFDNIQNGSITPLQILINAIVFILTLLGIAFTMLLSLLEFFINLPVYSFILLQTIGFPGYIIWPILVIIFAIEIWGLFTLFLRFISAGSGAR
jgi:hypothetical protein